MDYPKVIVSNQKEESISIQRLKYRPDCNVPIWTWGSVQIDTTQTC